MRKMLILVLVMGIASTANAAYTLVSSAGDTLDPLGIAFPGITVIGIWNDTAAANQGFTTFLTIPAEDPGSWTGNATINVPPAHGGTNEYFGVVDPGFGDVDMWQSGLGFPTTEPYGTGVLAGYEFNCTELGDVTISLRNESFEVIDTLTLSQIPEPITFALLGLGGLFLRRRK